METVYVCTGGCGGEVSESDYEGGKNICGAEKCPKFHQPFEKRLVCPQCEAKTVEGEEHICP